MGSITIAMIAILLASIMLLVVKGFTSKETTQEAIKEIIEGSTPNQILSEFKRQSNTLKVCALGGGLLTLMFAMTFFSGGDLNPFTWGFGQWLAVLVGAVVVFAITATQYNLYQDINGTKVAMALTIGILVFVFYSEIASTSERESELVRSRSVASPTLQATLGAIGSSNANITAPSGYEGTIAKAQGKKAQHEIELKRCNRHASKGRKRVERCVNYESKKIAEQQAIIDQYSQSASDSRQAIVTNTQGLIAQAKSLEYDENNHASIVKFFSELFGVSSLSAAMFAAFILVNAFELGFHYSGSRVGQLRAALARIGYDLETETNEFEIAKGQMDLVKLRDAEKTTAEMEKLKEKIKELSSNSNHSPTPKKKEVPAQTGVNFAPVAGAGMSAKVPLGDTGLSVATGAGFVKPMGNQGGKNETKNTVDNSTQFHQLPEQYKAHNSIGFVDTDNRPIQAKNSLNVSAETSPKPSLKQASSHKTRNKSKYQPDSSVLKQEKNPSSVLAQAAVLKQAPKQAFSDTDLLYPEWKRAVLNGDCKLTIRECREWVKKHLGVNTSRQVKKVADRYVSAIVDLLYVRGLKDGIIKLNPKWKEGSRIQKYLLTRQERAKA